jgi:hypothetical protein
MKLRLGALVATAASKVRQQLICHAAHYKPNEDMNGAKMRLRAIAVAARARGLCLAHLCTQDGSTYVLQDGGDVFVPYPRGWKTLALQHDLRAVIVAWSWNFRHHANVLEMLGTDRRPMLVFDSIDFMALRLAREFAATHSQFRTYNSSIDEEISACTSADLVLAVTEEEGAHLRALGARITKTVGYAPPSRVRPRRDVRPKGGSGPTAGFFGSQNAANLYSLLRSANLARMSGRVGRFNVVGSVCRYEPEVRSMQRLFGEDWFVVQGAVKDVDQFYSETDILINVLAFGSGIKIKNVEALSYGRPVITNSIGAEGIAADPQDGLFTADCLSEVIAALDQIAGRTFHTGVGERLAAQFETQVDGFLQAVAWSDP